MSILDEAQDNLRQDESAMQSMGANPGATEPNLDSLGVRLTDFVPDLSFLLAETGDGSIEDYLDHPLNSRKSHGLAQMLRGFTGIAGQLNYAIVDIALGAMEYRKEELHNATNSK